MTNTEAMFEAAEQNSSRERSTMIAAAQAVVCRAGTETCVDCDAVIPAARRAVAPFAVRCVDCQKSHERETLAR